MSTVATKQVPRLIVLDDDRSMVRLLTRVISQHFGASLDVEGCEVADKAMNRLAAAPCEILITDLEMPGVDGLELLQRVKLRDPWTQVICLTGHSTISAVSSAMRSGATDYLLKPVDAGQLIDVVEQSLARYARWSRALAGTVATAD